MGITSNGVPASFPEKDIFALVIYIPGTLGAFLDNLRRELVPSYNPHAHVSVLPPRPLAVDWRTASDQVRAFTESWPPFDIELTDLKVFSTTDVLYLNVGAGARELREMHDAMNCRGLEFQEPYPYHPHITLAQDVPREAVPELRKHALRRWDEFRGSRTFRAGKAFFVRNAVDNVWEDLAEYSLGTMAIR